MSRWHDQIKNDPRYKAWRRAVLDRDGSTCVQCGQAEGPIEADHITPLAVLFAQGITPEALALAFDVDNGQALCKPCNARKGERGGEPVEIRHTWVSPRYPAVSWLAERDTDVEPSAFF